MLDGVLRANEEGKKHVSLDLVRSDWASLGLHREIGDARAHNALLDGRAGYHRVDHRRRRFPYVFTPDK